VFIDDLVQILPIEVGIPDGFRIHDQHRTFFTAVQATGRIDADPARAGDTELLAALLDIIAHRPGIKTLAAGTAVRAQVSTKKDVVTIIGHKPNHTAEATRTKALQDVSREACYLQDMKTREQTFLDRCIAHTDRALRTVFGEPIGSGRDNPASPAENRELSSTDKAKSISMMRVNHAGEVCAQALYQGQALTAHRKETRDRMKQASDEENDHLAWCRQRLDELGGHTSLLNPLWYTGSLAIGAVSGIIGDKWSLGFLAETEHQVVKHLEAHLQKLPADDSRSRLILEQMKLDEAKHEIMAHDAGANDLPESAKKLMALASKVMTTTAYRI
jgi:ubiquinone biosynthesis monooxygenase Coq7